MITRFTKPQELVDEFLRDIKKAVYWQNKTLQKQGSDSLTQKRFRQIVQSFEAEKRSEPFFYVSPETGNKWMTWFKMFSRGYLENPTFKSYQVCYQLTAESMTIMLPSIIKNNEGMSKKGVTVYTDHVFLRMMQRLGVKNDDRLLWVRNFVEETFDGIVEIRDPLPGHHHKEAINRIPASWLVGNFMDVGSYYMIRYNTYYRDVDLSPAKRYYFKSIKAFADAFDSKDEIREYFNQKQ